MRNPFRARYVVVPISNRTAEVVEGYEYRYMLHSSAREKASRMNDLQTIVAGLRGQSPAVRWTVRDLP